MPRIRKRFGNIRKRADVMQEGPGRTTGGTPASGPAAGRFCFRHAITDESKIKERTSLVDKDVVSCQQVGRRSGWRAMALRRRLRGQGEGWCRFNRNFYDKCFPPSHHLPPRMQPLLPATPSLSVPLSHEGIFFPFFFRPSRFCLSLFARVCPMRAWQHRVPPTSVTHTYLSGVVELQPARWKRLPCHANANKPSASAVAARSALAVDALALCRVHVMGRVGPAGRLASRLARPRPQLGGP